MKKILNDAEMKQVRGGVLSSSLCGQGEKLYTCTTHYGNGFTSTGAVCSTTAYMARRAVLIQRTEEVQGDADIRWIECN